MEKHQADGRMEQPRDSLLHTVPSGLFDSWRRVIGSVGSIWPRTVQGVRSAARTWAAQWQRTTWYHRHAPEPWGDTHRLERETAAAIGARAFLFGMSVAGIIAASSGLWGPSLVIVGSEVLWAGMRFIIIALLMPTGTISRSRLSVAYLAGLLPYALGATWPLRFAALGCSAYLTHRGLVGAGVPSHSARTTVGWSFGGQAAILVGGWVLRAIIALLAYS